MNLIEEIQNYWNHRYKGYSKVNKKELEGTQRERWKQQCSFINFRNIFLEINFLTFMGISINSVFAN